MKFHVNNMERHIFCLVKIIEFMKLYCIFSHWIDVYHHFSILELLNVTEFYRHDSIKS